MALTTLRDRTSFRRVMAGRSSRADGLRVHAVHNGLDYNRYGVAATTAVGGAVVRNKVRRWSRELLRRWDRELLPGHDVVVFVDRKEARESGFAEFAANLAVSLKRSRLANGGLHV